MIEKNPTLSFTVPQIAWHALTVGRLLGHGGYGDVYQGQWYGNPVAIKQLHLKTLSTQPARLQEDFVNETEIMARCMFPQIVRLYGVCMEMGHYSIIMEYMPKGSLCQVLQDKKLDLPWAQRFEIAIDVGRGLSFLHSQNVLHRDLKSLNVLLDDQLHAKISDFGLSKIQLESSSISTKSNKTGTVRWRAPESFRRGFKLLPSMDMYSYGMVLWEIAARALPYADAKDEATAGIWIKNGKKENIPGDCPLEYAQIIQKTWSLPEKRPTAPEVTRELENAKLKPNPQAQSGKAYQLLPATELDQKKVMDVYQNLNPKSPVIPSNPSQPKPTGEKIATEVVPPAACQTNPYVPVLSQAKPSQLFAANPVQHSPTLFKPSPSAVNEKPLSYPEQVGAMSRMTKEKNQISQAAVEALLKWVTEGHLVEVETLLKKQPGLGLCTGTVTDLSGRTFKEVTALQYAAWSLDEEMCELLMEYINEYNNKIQLKALYDNPGAYSEHGDHYDIKPLSARCAIVHHHIKIFL